MRYIQCEQRILLVMSLALTDPQARRPDEAIPKVVTNARSNISLRPVNIPITQETPAETINSYQVVVPWIYNFPGQMIWSCDYVRGFRGAMAVIHLGYGSPLFSKTSRMSNLTAIPEVFSLLIVDHVELT